MNKNLRKGLIGLLGAGALALGGCKDSVTNVTNNYTTTDVSENRAPVVYVLNSPSSVRDVLSYEIGTDTDSDLRCLAFDPEGSQTMIEASINGGEYKQLPFTVKFPAGENSVALRSFDGEKYSIPQAVNISSIENQAPVFGKYYFGGYDDNNNFSISTTDIDGDSIQATLEYSVDNGATWYDPTYSNYEDEEVSGYADDVFSYYSEEPTKKLNDLGEVLARVTATDEYGAQSQIVIPNTFYLGRESRQRLGQEIADENPEIISHYFKNVIYNSLLFYDYWQESLVPIEMEFISEGKVYFVDSVNSRYRFDFEDREDEIQDNFTSASYSELEQGNKTDLKLELEAILGITNNG